MYSNIRIPKNSTNNPSPKLNIVYIEMHWIDFGVWAIFVQSCTVIFVIL